MITIDSLSLPPAPPSGLSGSIYTSQGKLYALLTWNASPSSGQGYSVLSLTPM